MFGLVRSWRRSKLKERSMPEHWPGILRDWFAFYPRLDDGHRETFHTHLKIFFWEKHWEGAGGLEVTEEMKVVISASAARIARGLPLSVYDRLAEVVVYPGTYRHPDRPGSGVLGTAHHFGTIVLSWKAVQKGIANPSDGRDTAIHEFAHALDRGGGSFDGTPLLEKGKDYSMWAQVMGRHFADLQEDPFRGVVRSYGAENEAEFFAVATEAFFETPRRLRQNAPDLYDVLAHYFRVDPV